MAKGYENIDEEKKNKTGNDGTNNNNNNNTIMVYNFFHKILIVLSKCCNDPRKYYEEQSNTGKSLIAFLLGFIVVLFLTLSTLGIIALSYMSICENSDSYYLTDSPQSLINLTNVVIFNRTPFGTIKIKSDSSNDKLQVSVKNYGLNGGNREQMTTMKRESQNLFHIQSKSINTATVLGYDSTCENAVQVFTVDPGYEFLGSIELNADESSDIVIDGTNTFNAGSQGISFNELNVNTMYGDVNMSYVDANSIKISSSFDISQTSNIPSYLLKSKANGLMYLKDVTVKDLSISTVTGNVLIENLVVKDGGSVNITTTSGTITLKNVGDGGDSYYISSESGYLIDITLNGRAFQGSYNAQAAEGVVFFSPTSNMHSVGPLCSKTDSWRKLKKLRERVGPLHHHCKQGSLGFAYGEQLLNIYAGKGDINLLAENLDL